MNPFKKYKGIWINDQLYRPESLLKAAMDAEYPAHLREVFAFAAKLFDRNKYIKVASSGSTGKPKKIAFPKKAFEQSALATNAFFGMGKDSKALLALPMRYIAGKMMVVRAIVGEYALQVVEPSSLPLDAMENDVTPFDLVPLTPYQALQSVEKHPKLLSAQGQVLIGGGLLSDELRRKLWLAKVNAFASFGMTETLTHFAIAELQSPEGDLLYRPLKGVQIKITKKGLLRVKWKGITEGWLETRDLAAAHREGFNWLGRGDNLINSGGIKVIPELVEKRLAHLIDAPFFVAGIPHPKLGEEVALFVEAEGSLSNQLLGEVQNVLNDTPFWQPRQVISMGRFDYTDTGKIKRLECVKRWKKEKLKY